MGRSCAIRAAIFENLMMLSKVSRKTSSRIWQRSGSRLELLVLRSKLSGSRVGLFCSSSAWTGVGTVWDWLVDCSSLAGSSSDSDSDVPNSLYSAYMTPAANTPKPTMMTATFCFFNASIVLLQGAKEYAK